MRAVEYAAAATSHGGKAWQRLAAGLRGYGFGDVCTLSNPTSGRCDGVTPSRTAVVLCEDTRGRRLCMKFYDESEQATEFLRLHVTCLTALRGVIPVPEIVGVEWTAERFGLPVLVTTYLGEPLDHAISRLSGDARERIAGQIADSLVATSRLDLAASGLGIPKDEEMRRSVARRFADDSAWSAEHAPAEPEAVRDLVLRGAKILASAEVTSGAARLCHSDLVTSNILVRDGSLSGLVDWDYAEVAPPELDLGMCMLGLLVSIPIARRERVCMLEAMLERYEREAGGLDAGTMSSALVFALDALLDWTIGGKDAPLDDLTWALSGIMKAIHERLPLGKALC